MGLFKKKVKTQDFPALAPPTLPELPELPTLPELPPVGAEVNSESLPKLPSFPNSDLGKAFSQNSVKDAVSGEKEGDEEVKANELEFPEVESPMMQEPLAKPRVIEEDEDYESTEARVSPKTQEVPSHFRHAYASTKKAEPIFIRIDKFEESLKIFEKAREQISDIEEMIRQTKEIKAKEEQEMDSWEAEIQLLKQEVEKIDQDIFSKVE